MVNKVYITKLKQSPNGYDVHTTIGIFLDVNGNTVECAVGHDLPYLLATKGDYLNVLWSEVKESEYVRDLQQVDDYGYFGNLAIQIKKLANQK